MNWVNIKPTDEGYYWVWSRHYPDFVIIMYFGETNRDGPGFFEQDAWMPIPKPSLPTEIK